MRLVEAGGRSVTDIDGIVRSSGETVIASASSDGAVAYVGSEPRLLLATPACSVKVRSEADDVWILVGSAAPRHNQIHVFHNYQKVGSLSGHEDWITSFAWSKSNQLLASGSQDGRIRLWKFTRLDADCPSVTETDQEDDDDEELGESRLEFTHGKSRTVVSLEALLMGHEDMVTSVSWSPSPEVYGQDNLLVSSSMDRSVLLWCPGEDGIWSPISRVGSAGGILGGSVGSTLLGYLFASLSPKDGKTLMAHAYGGSIHFWSLDDKMVQAQPAESLTVDERASLLRWRATPCVTGHFGSVTDLCWEAYRGDYLLTVSQDQTCRLWAAIDEGVWVELARPQVHGYDLSAVVSISDQRMRHRIVTGADEKELRVFDAPKSTVRALAGAAGISDDETDPVDRVDRAYIPSLGLSNIASAAEAAEEQDDEKDGSPEESQELELPMERDLGAVSLWPEVEKLFGHNTELYCLTSNVTARTKVALSTEAPDEIIVASSCKARDEDAATILLWRDDECIGRLRGHKSTVADMCFSPCGRYFVSSGKDRRLCLWKRDDSGSFVLSAAKDSAHKRIVWAVHFCPFDATVFASASRDGTVKLWNINESDGAFTLQRTFSPRHTVGGKPDAVTALSIAPRPLSDGNALVALGLESGRLEFWSVPISTSESSVELVCDLDDSFYHSATVTRLAWKPLAKDEDELLLASCSVDQSCRIVRVETLC